MERRISVHSKKSLDKSTIQLLEEVGKNGGILTSNEPQPNAEFVQHNFSFNPTESNQKARGRLRFESDSKHLTISVENAQRLPEKVSAAIVDSIMALHKSGAKVSLYFDRSS